MVKESVKILALIPAFNEQDHIASVVQRASHFLPIVVVDDGSVDETSEIAKASGAIVIRQEPNQGKGAAMIKGFRYALDQGYDAVICLDGDGQHDPDEIPEFITEYKKNHTDLIIGSRDFRKMPFIRMCSNTIGTWMFSWAMGQHIPDNQSGYRLISSQLMIALVSSKLQGFEFEVEMIMRCILNGQKLGWVTIQTIYAGEHSHIHPIKHAWRFILLTFRTRRSMCQARK